MWRIVELYKNIGRGECIDLSVLPGEIRFCTISNDLSRNEQKEIKPDPKKPEDEGCNSEALMSVSSEYTVEVQNFQASTLLFTVWALKLG